MNYKKDEIKKGITLHQIYTDKFKTNIYAVFLATPLSRETITKNPLITAILRRGSNNLKTQEQINKELEEIYGANFDCGIEKSGDNHVFKFYIESINDEYLPNEEITKKSLDILFDIIFNPLVENNCFKQAYLDGEKKNLQQIIEGKIDNKAGYAYNRCIEEMFKNKPYGLYKYGYIQDIKDIKNNELYEYYRNLIDNCKIDIFVSGKNDNKKILKLIKENDNIVKLKERNPIYKTIDSNKNESITEVKKVEESMDVIQGKLIMGLDIQTKKENKKYIASVFNAILGGGANSKLFQNVREKESLAYTVGSSYIKSQNCIIIRAGIEIDKFDKAVETIKKQIEDIKNGDFTDEDMINSKQLITSTIENTTEEQDTEITYDYSCELSNEFIEIDKYIENINKVTRNEIIDIAKSVKLNTTYFLKD